MVSLPTMTGEALIEYSPLYSKMFCVKYNFSLMAKFLENVPQYHVAKRSRTMPCCQIIKDKLFAAWRSTEARQRCNKLDRKLWLTPFFYTELKIVESYQLSIASSMLQIFEISGYIVQLFWLSCLTTQGWWVQYQVQFQELFYRHIYLRVI